MSLTPAVAVERRKLIQRVREEFEEIPGLRFTVQEAARFWALDEDTCESILLNLAAAGFLARVSDSRFEIDQRA
jgi:hypothetical protein